MYPGIPNPLVRCVWTGRNHSQQSLPPPEFADVFTLSFGKPGWRSQLQIKPRTQALRDVKTLDAQVSFLKIHTVPELYQIEDCLFAILFQNTNEFKCVFLNFINSQFSITCETQPFQHHRIVKGFLQKLVLSWNGIKFTQGGKTNSHMDWYSHAVCTPSFSEYNRM